MVDSVVHALGSILLSTVSIPEPRCVMKQDSITISHAKYDFVDLCCTVRQLKKNVNM